MDDKKEYIAPEMKVFLTMDPLPASPESPDPEAGDTPVY